jgi:hypothetical protein
MLCRWCISKISHRIQAQDGNTTILSLLRAFRFRCSKLWWTTRHHHELQLHDTNTTVIDRVNKAKLLSITFDVNGPQVHGIIRARLTGLLMGMSASAPLELISEYERNTLPSVILMLRSLHTASTQ